jgi:gas vesicle protein
MNKAYMVSVGILSGLAAGAVLGMLFAPHTGAETRSMIKERTQDVRNRAGETVSTIRRRVKNMAPMGAD